ncbi:MAG: AAA family ATPase [bacterium]|nr:AAA family ATPase [bacterium]
MHLLRVQVPDFRVLQDVDIQFEKDFTPRIFPVGSLNGGGKSTLLQLIFVLLHCAGEPGRHEYIQNLLKGYEVKGEDGKQTLAKFEVWTGEEVVEIEFICCNDNFLKNSLKLNRLPLIINYWSNIEGKKANYLLFHIDGIKPEESNAFLEKLSNKIFLVSPPTQVCLFLSEEYRKILFNKEDAYSYYYGNLIMAKKTMPGLNTYNFIPADSIIDFFKAARDKDFKEVVKTGKYGNNYQTLLKEANLLLTPKKLRPDPDLKGVIFQIEKDGETIELFPEDLSHGELRRLSIYTWLKSKDIDDSIVLMDEIEISLHPDWEYQVVRDLEQWAPNNQYILATHSYALCEALTPAHVKELEPRLTPPEHKQDKTQEQK